MDDHFRKQLLLQMMLGGGREPSPPQGIHTSQCLKVLSRARQPKKITLLQRFKLVEEATNHALEAKAAGERSLDEDEALREKQVEALISCREGLRKLLVAKTLTEVQEVTNLHARPGGGTALFSLKLTCEETHKTFKWGFKTYMFAVVDKFFSMMESECVDACEKNAQERAGVVADEVLGQEECSLPTPPAELDPRRAGVRALSMVNAAAKRKATFRKCPAARVEMLREACLKARIFRPSNWISDGSGIDHNLAFLQRSIVGCEAILRTQTWEALAKEFIAHYDPIKACSAIITEKKAMKVMRFCVEARVRHFCIFRLQPGNIVENSTWSGVGQGQEDADAAL